jgi:hypothetical protein
VAAHEFPEFAAKTARNLVISPRPHGLRDLDMHPFLARAAISLTSLTALGVLPALADQPAAVGGGTAAMSMPMPMGDHGSPNTSNELEFFPSLEILTRSATSIPVSRDDDPVLRVDTIFGHTSQGFHLFGEFQATTDGELDLERFQAGYEIDPDTLIWVGRFHQPASAWNTQHHHGQYLQTAISRPMIERWEDEQGLVPQHITGVLLESHRPVGDTHGIQWAVGAGAAPTVTGNGLEPIDLLDRNDGEHRLSTTARVAFLPDYLGANNIALLLGRDAFAIQERRAALALDATGAYLSLAGVAFDWSVDAWRVIGTWYSIGLDLSGVHGEHTETFGAGYLQVERTLPQHFTVFGRIEPSSRAQDAKYVALIARDDDFAFRRDAVGLRWDFLRHQALTTELSHSDSFHTRYSELRLQWSAALP